MKSIITAGNFTKSCILSLLVLLTASFSTQAQSCLTDNLDVSTANAIANPLAVLAPGQNDPRWTVTTSSTLYGPLSNIPAFVVNPWSGWGAGQWISVSQQAASPGLPCPNNELMTFSRPFEICQSGTFEVDLNVLVDNYITTIILNDITNATSYPIFLGGTPQNSSNLWTNAQNYNSIFTLPAGQYTLDIEIGNFGVPGSPAPNNVVGLAVNGTITETSQVNSLVSDLDPDCEDYECGSCDDLCYWRVTGNNIHNGNNIFGTLSPHSVDIQTEGSDRGILTPGGSNISDPVAGRLGWNTMNPTARLHVDCIYGNEDGSGLSDIRFENLERGNGHILVISPDGYVYDSETEIGTGGVTNHCGMIDFVTKTDANGDLDCSQIYDDGISVGINKTSGFNYSGGGVFTAGSPSAGTVLLDVDGMFRSVSMVATSDARYKTNVTSLENSLEKVMSLNPVEYNWKHDQYPGRGFDKLKHSGFIAQELEEILPNSVIIDESGDYAVDYNSIIPVLAQAIKEQNEVINSLQERINQLEGNSTHTKDVNPENGNILFQNTPNPFDSKTTIEYSISNMEQSAFIIIYDLNGKELIKTQVEEGKGRISIDGGSLLSGMYLYSLVVDGQEQDTKRMVLSK